MDRLAVPQPTYMLSSSSSSSLLSPPSRTPSYRRSVNVPRRPAERPARRSTIAAVLALGRRASLSRFLSEQREMRATVRMAIIIACFCGMWVGFFVLYVVSGWCPATACPVPRSLRAADIWLGFRAVTPVRLLRVPCVRSHGQCTPSSSGSATPTRPSIRSCTPSSTKSSERRSSRFSAAGARWTVTPTSLGGAPRATSPSSRRRTSCQRRRRLLQ